MTTNKISVIIPNYNCSQWLPKVIESCLMQKYLHEIIVIDDNLTIEDEIAIGLNCVIYTHDHNYNVKEKAAWKGRIVPKSITIKKGAWVGSNVTLLPGIEIGKRCVIAAGAVITKTTKDNSIYGGIPATKLKNI